MGLIKCPDCEKKISDRVEACPFCGCPSNFFKSQFQNNNGENQSKSERINTKATKEHKIGDNTHTSPNDYDIVEKKNEMISEQDKEEVFDTFTFLGRTISYPKNASLFISSIKAHNNVAAKFEKELEKKYNEVKLMDKVWDDVVPLAKQMIDRIVKENVKYLYENNIYISEKDFKYKYNIDIWGYLKKMENAYDSLINGANNLLEMRQYERSGRSHWEGGGFGLKGAITGAITAGALNAVTEAGRAIKDSVVDSNDSANLEKQKQVIYENESYRKDLLFGLRRCIALADIGMAEEFADAGVTARIEININNAIDQFALIREYEKNEYCLAQKSIDIINMYPLMPIFYNLVILQVIARDDGIDDLIRFLKFWNMREDFASIFADEPKRKLIDQYIKEHPEIKKINFEEFRPNTYIKIKKAKKDLLKEQLKNKMDLELPTTAPFCLEINNYLEKCLSYSDCLDSVDILDELNDTISVIEFIHKIQNEKMFLPGLLENIWIRGDNKKIPEEKILNKWKLPKTDKIYMYQNNAIFGTAFGGEGFVLTDTYICDLKSKQKILLNEIKNGKFDDREHKIHISNDTIEICINVGDEKPATRLFLYNCIEYFVHHYRETNYMSASTSEFESVLVPEMITEPESEHAEVKIKILCSKCNSEINSNVKFCNFCGEFSPLYYVECLSCGKKIKKGTRFCNYCGQVFNNESDINNN